MDALWSLEDKWKISTQKAVVLLICTAVLVSLACATVIGMVFRKKGQRNRIANLDSDNESESSSLIIYEEQSCCRRCTFYVKNVIVGSACWSMANKWSSDDFLAKCVRFSGCLGSKLPPVWQRPILMGRKCEFLKTSGLILYDERGRPLPHHHPPPQQEEEEESENTISCNHVGQVMENYHGIQEGEEIEGCHAMLKDFL
ncbi:uncharacterized protein LOC141647058 [Silene latifolia]|uniref:uncharacterized protein LOC141647058 n=1 Tax=Silene latifolia TaxID=37657 RepID=UPI003D7818CE